MLFDLLMLICVNFLDFRMQSDILKAKIYDFKMTNVILFSNIIYIYIYAKTNYFKIIFILYYVE